METSLRHVEPTNVAFTGVAAGLIFAGFELIAQFTYGVVAAPNTSREELGLERLHKLIERYGRHEAEYLCVKVGQHLDDWMRSADREEDCVLLAVKIKE